MKPWYCKYNAIPKTYKNEVEQRLIYMDKNWRPQIRQNLKKKSSNPPKLYLDVEVIRVKMV